MKKTFFPLTLLCMIYLGQACGSRADDQVKVAQEHNKEKFDAETEKTADFMVYAADLSLHAKQLAELAAGNAENNEVKKLAKVSLNEHEKALSDLQKIAKDKNISLPDAPSRDHQRDCDKLGKEKGKDFDHDYSDMIVNENQKAITRFEKAADRDKDEVVRKWAFEMLPVLRTQLDFAMSCREKGNRGSSDTAVVMSNDWGKAGTAHAKTDDRDKKSGSQTDQTEKKNKKTDW